MNRRKTREHFVSLINLIILIIINYQLSIERSSLVFNSQSSFFFYTAPKLSLKMSKSFCTLCLSLKLLTASQRALSARLLFSDMYTRVKSSLCLRAKNVYNRDNDNNQFLTSFLKVWIMCQLFFLQHSVHSFCCHVLPFVSASLKKHKAWAVLVGFVRRPKTMFYINK